MSQQFVGELRIFSFDYAPRGWAQCNGQLLPINQNQALFSLLGTTYGGNGVTTFALPDLRARYPMHMGQGPGLSSRFQGEVGGVESVALTVNQMPSHTHVPATAAAATFTSPAGQLWAPSPDAVYGTAVATDTKAAVNGTMEAGVLASTGGNLLHENRAPALALTICIALQGIFPARN